MDNKMTAEQALSEVQNRLREIRHHVWGGGIQPYKDVSAIENLIELHVVPALSAPRVPADLEDYDSGMLNDYGGGNVGWRQQIAKANDLWRQQIAKANDLWRQQIEAGSRSASPEPVARADQQVIDDLREGGE